MRFPAPKFYERDGSKNRLRLYKEKEIKRGLKMKNNKQVEKRIKLFELCVLDIIQDLEDEFDYQDIEEYLKDTIRQLFAKCLVPEKKKSTDIRA